jgi:hypothetical protein
MVSVKGHREILRTRKFSEAIENNDASEGFFSSLLDQ